MRKITLLLALLALTSVKAQWTTDTAVNTLVVNTTDAFSESIGTSDGRTYVVFWKSVPAPTNFELRLQLLNIDGTQQFGPDGMLISNTIPMSTSTVIWKIAIDKSDNIYVGVTGTGTGTPGIVYKVATNGTMLWGSNGVNLGPGYLPTVLPLDTGEVIISYYPGSGKSKIQKFSALGVPLWANPVDVVSTNATSSTVPADIYEMANHDVVLVFHRRLGFGVASNLFAQRYSYTDGTPQWTTPAQLADKGTAYNTTYNGTQDGDTVFYGYSGVTGTAPRFDSFLQRINADGTTPWGLNGVDFDTSQAYYEKDIKVECTPGSGHVWAMARYTPSSQDLQGEYVQKFDKTTGNRLLTDSAKQVFMVDNNYRNHSGKMFLVNDLPIFLIKTGFDNGATPTTLRIVQLNDNGGFAWAEETFPIATFNASKGRITLNRPVNNQIVTVFSEAKVTGEPKTYAQNFVLPTLGNGEFEPIENNIVLYPNPSNSLFNINSNENIETVKVVDMQGKVVYTNNQVNQLQSTVDATTWAKGIYIMTVTTSTTKPQSFKIVKS